jgi:arabinogalactan endo-1,4-beta-galactosidase
LNILLDLHYSDTWADGSNQAAPSAWAGQHLPALAATVRKYTRNTVRAFAAQGTPVDMVQIGNEIAHGMLWPQGQIYSGGDADGTPVTENWDGFLTLLKAGLQGATEAGGSSPRTVVHINNGCDNAGSRYFYDRLAAAGVHFDVIAVSYYAFWHGSLPALQSNLADLAVRYGKDVLVAETSYPWKLPVIDEALYHVSSADQLPDGDLFPASATGQTSYFDALRNVISRLPGGHGLGFIAWEPAWLPGVTRNSEQELLYSNLTMFDWTGAALPSLAAFRSP